MKKNNLIVICLYIILFLAGAKALFHGFPDTERFFGEWMDEGFVLTNIMKLGSLNFAPKTIIHPPLYYYLSFIPIGTFFVIGKLIGFFSDKMDFARFYFNNMHYFFLIARTMSYVFYWLAAAVIFKIVRLFYDKKVAHITTFAYLVLPRFIFDFSTTRPETLLFLNCSIFFYFFLKYYLDGRKLNFLLLSAFFLGVSSATKYNALFLGFIFVPLLFSRIKNGNIDYKGMLLLLWKICLFAFLGFFICNPIFIIKFKTYFYNLFLFDTVRIQHIHKEYWPAVFFITHIKRLGSLDYLNFFGLLILTFGCYALLKKERKLFFFSLLTILIFEIYFAFYHRDCSPLYFLNPLLPIMILLFSAGIDSMFRFKKQLMSILIIFFLISFSTYVVYLKDFSARPTYLQKARAFIEKHIPEFTNICVASINNLPQLNMTRGSYNHLVDTAPVSYVEGKGVSFEQMCREMDSKENYDSIFRELKIRSLMKSPQYNLVRLNKNLKTEEEIVEFFRKNDIKYVISCGICMIAGEEIEDMHIVSLVKRFKPNNQRVYMEDGVYLYKVN